MFTQRIWLGCLRQLASRNQGRMGHTAKGEFSQYDVSEKMKKLFEIKHKQREATKAYLQKIVMNPYRPKSDPVPFDPVLFRYNAFMTYHDDYFTPDLSNWLIFFGVYILPIILLSLYITNYRTNLEKQLRGGEVAYKDRFFKNFL